MKRTIRTIRNKEPGFIHLLQTSRGHYERLVKRLVDEDLFGMAADVIQFASMHAKLEELLRQANGGDEIPLYDPDHGEVDPNAPASTGIDTGSQQ